MIKNPEMHTRKGKHLYQMVLSKLDGCMWETAKRSVLIARTKLNSEWVKDSSVKADMLT